MPARTLAIEVPHERIAEFCRKWGIRKLSFFGSVTREDFDPERSDVDVLVEFKQIPSWEYYWDMPNELSEIFGRKVDLRTPAEISPRAMPRVLNDLIEEYDES
jgi:predicted nucleotidyltransferase